MTKIKYTLIATVGVILLLVLTLFYVSMRKPTIVFQGEVETDRVDMSIRVQGRAVKVNYDVGDNVKEGDLLLVLENPALIAQKATSEAQYEVAVANRNVVYSTRPETIEVQKALLEKAEADLVLAESNLERMQKAIETGGVSQQNYDVAKNNYEVALKAKLAAKANLELAVNGNSPEAKKLADAQVDQAKAAMEQIQNDINTLTVYSPINGQITAKVAEVGQLYNPGSPLYSMIKLDDLWMTFNIREDYLHYAKVGDIFNVYIPAIDRRINVKITTINALGQYANWRATKATGDFDLKTFEVRVKPTEKIEGLRPGMSVIADWKTVRTPDQ